MGMSCVQRRQALAARTDEVVSNHVARTEHANQIASRTGFAVTARAREGLSPKMYWWNFRRRLSAQAAQRNSARFLMERPELRSLIQRMRKTSDSHGVSDTDFVALYLAVRKLKPKVVLECGTGMSTHIIAQAMLDEFGPNIENLRLVSMEHIKKWRDHNDSLLPARFRDFVEIVHSPAVTYFHSIFRGSAYEQIPDHPYEFVFIDGPAALDEDGSLTVGLDFVCNMDFVRLILHSENPVWGIVDGRKLTVLAYHFLFGPNKVVHYPGWNLSVIRGVTKEDILKEDEMVIGDSLFRKVVQHSFGRPLWMRPRR